MPFDGMPFDPALRYVVVARDPRDVFMSLWNHCSNYTDAALAELNDGAAALGGAFPPAPNDIRKFWAQWIGRGWFPWEREGWPFWSSMGQLQGWWDQRDRPNVTLVHYDDLLARPAEEIARLARRLDIACEPVMAARIAEVTRFAAMKRDARRLVGHNDQTFRGGADTFINKGVNGCWRAVLTPDDMALYAAKAEAIFRPDCRSWVEREDWKASGTA
jgi:aryl sulfotransferase